MVPLDQLLQLTGEVENASTGDSPPENTEIKVIEIRRDIYRSFTEANTRNEDTNTRYGHRLTLFSTQE